MDPAPSIEDVLASCTIVQQYIYEHMLNDGNIESNVMILDMTDQGVFDINYSILKGIMSFTGAVWRGKHRNFFIMNAPKTFDVLFKFAQPFMDQSQRAKVQITSGNTNTDLLELCHPSQLPKRVGGTQPDRVAGEFWPPQIPTDTFGNEGAS